MSEPLKRRLEATATEVLSDRGNEVADSDARAVINAIWPLLLAEITTAINHLGEGAYTTEPAMKCAQHLLRMATPRLVNPPS